MIDTTLEHSLPANAVYEKAENELVVKAELPDLRDKDIDVRITNNTLTIRGERMFEKDVKEDINRFLNRLEHGDVASRVVLEFARC
jgi:HSP20 family molecular chaperone IbpA